MIKNSKKMLSFLLAFLMVFSMFAAFAVSNASAATNPVVSIVSDDYSVKVGDTFNVSIVVNNGTYVADTVLMAARYNPNIFEYTGVSSKNATYVGSVNPAAPAGAVGTGYIGFLFNKAKGNGGDMPTSTDFTMYTVQLRVKAGVAAGPYKVENSPLPATGAKILKHSSTATTNWGATITTYNDATITVEPSTVAVTGVSIDAGTKPGTVEVGASGTLTATVAPGDATNKTISWASDSSAVSINSSTGAWSAVSAGTARITVATQDGSKTDYCDVTVLSADKSPTLGLEWVSGTTLKATLGNYRSAQTYQVWVEQVNASGVGSGWVLLKTFGGSFTTAAGATATQDFTVSTLTPSYRMYVRYKVGEVTYQVSKQFVINAAETPIITALDVAGETQFDGVVYATATKTFNLSVAAACSAGMSYEWSNATSVLGTASTLSFTPAASGEYVIGVKVSNALNGTLSAVKRVKFVITNTNAPYAFINANAPLVSSVINGAVSLGLGANFTASVGNAPLFKFALSEPFKGGAQFKANYGLGNSAHFNVKAPGYYSAAGYISSGDRNVDEDYVVKSVHVARTFGGTASLTTDVVEEAGTYSITATGAGLTNGVGYQYSFWRIDANGKNLVKNWSSDNTLTWTPTRDGNYTIVVRVRGDKDNTGAAIASAKVGTYEAAKNLDFTIGSPSAFAGASISVSATPTKRNPVTLTVNGVADTAVYSFSVSDVNRGSEVIRGFAPSNECIWVPDKPGDYVVTAKINGQGSFGYADDRVTTNVTVAP